MRRGNIPIETIFVLIVILVIVLSAFVGNLLLGELNDDIQASNDFGSTAKNMSQTFTNRYTTIFDGVVLGLFILLWGMAIVASLFVDTHPIFFIFSIIMLAVVLVAGAFISETYTDFVTDPTFSGYDTQFPMTHFLMTNLLVYLLIVGFFVGLVLYGKMRGQP